ncbi:MAG TPA: chitosanase, partial [Candidatus Saccharimonadales bacterium]|nr:chitosanase [Candidatus Saccharimonadales bacterium]
MPRTSASAKKPTSRAKKAPAKNTNWLFKARLHTLAKPLVYVVAFMIVGASSLVWASAATTSYGVFGSNAVPKIIAADDRHNLELGMKFTPKVAGYVTGVRFYKAAQNTGTHTGSLWTTGGRQLATVTFTKETKSGWQSATFSKPVSVAANVTYVVSYHAPKGRYSVDFKYFYTDHANKQLQAVKAKRSNVNGVYKYSNSTSFPNEDGSGANYWVDVIFSNKLINAPVAPAAPGNVVANVQASKSVLVRWQASASATPLKNYEVYRDGVKKVITTGVTYEDKTTVAGKSYAYQVKAIDTKGVASALSAKVTVTVPATTGGSTGGGGNSTTPPPSTQVNLFNASKKEIAMQLVSSAENSSLNWKAQYSYLEDIKDGRGYTGGIIGFCSGTSDMLQMVKYYAKIAPNNVLAKYIPALEKVNGTASHTGLGAPFEAAWKTAAKDVKFQEAQNYMRDTMYFNPAVNQAIADGLKSLGQFAYYDAMVVHGPGSDAVSFGGIRAAALKKAKTPAQGGNETTYLNAFMDVRNAAMKTEAAHEDTSRVDTAQRVFLKAGNLNLDPPLSWKVYGDPYTISKNP